MFDIVRKIIIFLTIKFSHLYVTTKKNSAPNTIRDTVAGILYL